MTQQSFGKVFGAQDNTFQAAIAAFNRGGDTPSNVQLGFLSSSPLVLSQSTGAQDAIYLSDDEGERGFAVYSKTVGTLQVYSVVPTGSASISTVSITTGSIAALALPFSLKRVSASLYYLYYFELGDVKRLDVIPGGAATINVVASPSTSAPDFVRQIDNIYYLGYADLNALTYDINIYSLNLDTGAWLLVTSWSAGGVAGNTRRFTRGLALGLVSTMGVLIWGTCYVEKNTSTNTTKVYVVIDGGAPTEVYSETGVSSPPNITAGTSTTTTNYNARDYRLIFDAAFGVAGFNNYYSYIAGVLSVGNTAPSPLARIAEFISDHTFPLIALSGGAFYNLSLATGEATTQISILGVISGDIDIVWPTLDTISGGIFVSAKVSGVRKLISINTAGVILQEWAVDASQSLAQIQYGFNHGNFLAVPLSVSPNIFYLANNVDVHDANGVQMIAEFN